VQLYGQRSSTAQLQQEDNRDLCDAKETEREAGKKSGIQQRNVANARQVARNSKLQRYMASSMVIGIFNTQSNCETSIQNTTAGMSVMSSSGTNAFQI
jgi:hypothetical protein